MLLSKPTDGEIEKCIRVLKENGVWWGYVNNVRRYGSQTAAGTRKVCVEILTDILNGTDDQ